jgi:glycosyltransferase involved in cell wall biosynthesis
MGPLVSIITPSYNQADFIEETILSVLNQSYLNIEYIIIDGASTDKSVEIIKKYAEKIAYWISEPDKGQADAINKGFRVASGEFICWINSDDILYKDFVKRRIDEFTRNPEVDFIYGDVDQGYYLEDSWLRKGKSTSYFEIAKSLEVPIPQQSSIWRRKVLSRTGFLDPRWHVLLDMDYFIRIAKIHKILYIPGATGFFRMHKLSKSVYEEQKWAEEYPLYYEELVEEIEVYEELRESVLCKCYFNCYKIKLAAGNLSEAKVFLIKSKNQSMLCFMKLYIIQKLVAIKRNLFFKFDIVIKSVVTRIVT